MVRDSKLTKKYELQTFIRLISHYEVEVGEIVDTREEIV